MPRRWPPLAIASQTIFRDNPTGTVVSGSNSDCTDCALQKGKLKLSLPSPEQHEAVKSFQSATMASDLPIEQGTRGDFD
jgi:hypothetical protein